MNDLIPERFKAWAGLIVSLIVAVLAIAMEWQNLGPQLSVWLPRCFAILVVVSNVLGLRVINPKVKP
jgi:nicotinamide riboside transporter PnuC